jgi:hypothetical protein
MFRLIQFCQNSAPVPEQLLKKSTESDRRIQMSYRDRQKLFVFGANERVMLVGNLNEGAPFMPLNLLPDCSPIADGRAIANQVFSDGHSSAATSGSNVLVAVNWKSGQLPPIRSWPMRR